MIDSVANSVQFVLLLLSVVSTAKTAFTEVPTSQEVAIGDEAVFRCRHSTADLIAWRINGTSLGSDRPPDVSPDSERTSDGTVEHTLTITGLPEYNGTTVDCVALFFDGSPTQITPTATLILQVSTTTDSSTSMPTPTPPGFTLIPTPLSLVAAVGQNVSYHCEHPDADAIFWTLNGTSLNLNGTISSIAYTSWTSETGIRTLRLRAEPSTPSNITNEIQCVAYLRSSRSEIETPPVTLQIQGRLSSPDNLHCNRLNILTHCTWDPSPSLNLTNIEPDVVYIVELYDITCGWKNHTEIGSTTETNFLFNHLQMGHMYQYVVTPRSNVIGSVSGYKTVWNDIYTITDTFFERFKTISKSVNVPMIDVSIYLDLSGSVDPNIYSIWLSPIDGVNEDNHTLPAKSETSGNLLHLTFSLQPGRRWNYAILPFGCLDNTDGIDGQISTHDVQNISVTSPSPGELRASGDFIEGSTATGIVIAIYSHSNLFYLSVSRTETLQSVALQNLPSGPAIVSVFVLDNNGVPYNRSASDVRSVYIDDGGDEAEPSFAIHYKMVSDNCIECTFLKSSPRECVVVLQRVSQFNSSGLMNMKSYRFARSGDTASGCIESVDLTHYQVGVIGGRLVNETNSGIKVCQTVPCVSLSVLCSMVVALIIILIIVVMLGRYFKTRGDHKGSGESTAANDGRADVNIEMEKCGAYEIVSLSRKKVTMTENVAYGETGSREQSGNPDTVLYYATCV